MYNVFQKIKFSLMKIKEHDNECVLVLPHSAVYAKSLNNIRAIFYVPL